MFNRGRQGTDYNVAPAVADGSGKLVRLGRWWFTSPATKAFSMIFVVVMVGGVLTMLVWPKPDSVANSPSTSSTAPSSVRAPAPAAGPAPVCKAQKAEPKTPEQVVLATYKTTWTRVGDMAEPSSAAAGPARKDPYPMCFSRNPEGALYSATSFAVNAISASAEGDLKTFFTVRASHTGNFDMLIADLPAGSPPQNRPTISISGYLWNSYTPDQASVQIRYRTVDGVSLAKVYNLAWENNDWLLVVPGPGDSVSTDPVNKSFTPWGGV